MKLLAIFHKNYNSSVLAILPITIACLILILASESTLAKECPHTNYMIVDGKCVNLDPQMKSNKPEEQQQPVSQLDELTDSSVKTYGSIGLLLLSSVGGWKFLNRG